MRTLSLIIYCGFINFRWRHILRLWQKYSFSMVNLKFKESYSMVDHLMPGFSSTMKVYRYSTKTDEIAVHDFLKYTVSSQECPLFFQLLWNTHDILHSIACRWKRSTCRYTYLASRPLNAGTLPCPRHHSRNTSQRDIPILEITTSSSLSVFKNGSIFTWLFWMINKF